MNGRRISLLVGVVISFSGISTVVEPYSNSVVKIDASGKVGVGTSSPEKRLHVVDDTIPNTIVSQYADLLVEGDESTIHLIADNVGDWGANLILANAPSSGGNKFWSLMHTGPGEDNKLVIAYGTSIGAYGFTALGNERMVIDTLGKVGIGTTAPRGRLVVSDGSIYLDNCQYLYGRNAANTADVGMLAVDGVNNTRLTASQALNFSTGGSTHAFLTAAGDFGIGTTTPGARLHANGRIVGGNATPSSIGTQFAVRTSGLSTWAALASLQTDGVGADDKYFLAMRSDEDGSPDNEFIFRTNGDAVADGSWTGGGADYAEWFEKEEQIPQGSLVGLNLDTGKARIWRKDDPFIGVQSMNPGFIGNNTIGAEDTPKEMKEDHVLVALIGQVEIRSNNISEKDRRVSTSDGQFIGWKLANGKVFVK
jgi:hypothetical protein